MKRLSIMLFGITLIQCESLATSYFLNRSRPEQKKSNSLNIVGLMSEEESEDDFYSMKNVFDCTITLINEGLFHDLLNDTHVNFRSVDPKCDELTAVNAFVDIAMTSKGKMDAVIGPRCSSGALYTAALTTKFKILQVSPSASSNNLEGKYKFPFFSRLVASVDVQAKAMVAMFQHFHWTRVSIIATDSEYSKSYVTAFRSHWKNASQCHEIVTSELVTLNQDDSVNQESAKLALEHIPVDDPIINSRVILLVAYDEQAHSILRTAYETAFQPDTIWVGTETWIGRTPKNHDMYISKSPGYIGITPFRNRDEHYKKFLKKFHKCQERNGKVPIIQEFPDYVAENLVDSILAVAKAFSNTPLHLRNDPQYVTSELRKLKFHGVSGYVAFQEDGDRLDPRYQIYNMQNMKGIPKWIPIGEITTKENTRPTIHMTTSQIVCFAEIGCTKNYPSDRYETQTPPNWVAIGIIAFFIVLLICICVLGAFHCLSHQGGEDPQKVDSDLRILVKKSEKFNISRDKSIKQLVKSHRSPSTWSKSKEILVEIQSSEEEFQMVERNLRESMDNAHISKLWRIQNKSLWVYYCLQKDRLSMNKIPLNEQNVWHGTSEVDPAIIYRDKQDGFMMQVSQKGSWGRGIYFAAKSSYSDKFAFRPAKQSSKKSWWERPDVWTGDRELLLTKLLVGNEIDFKKPSPETKSFVVPPRMPGSDFRYDTVTGVTGNSKVWVVYENGRAYPEYLVRYYRTERGNPVSTEIEPAKEQVSFKMERSINVVQDLEANHNHSSRNDSHNQSGRKLKWYDRSQMNMASSQVFKAVKSLVGKRNNSSDSDSQNQSGRILKWSDRSQINMASSQSFNGVQGHVGKRNNSSDSDSQYQSGRKLKWSDRSQINMMASSQSFDVVQGLLAKDNNSSRNDSNNQSDEEFKLT